MNAVTDYRDGWLVIREAAFSGLTQSGAFERS